MRSAGSSSTSTTRSSRTASSRAPPTTRSGTLNDARPAPRRRDRAPERVGRGLARQWPIDGAVTENGAVHVVARRRSGVALLRARAPRRSARTRRVRLARHRRRRPRRRPRGAAHRRHRRAPRGRHLGHRRARQAPRGPRRRIADVIASAGARSSRSSVHIHATFDTDDKATGPWRSSRASSATTRAARSSATPSSATAGTTLPASARSRDVRRRERERVTRRILVTPRFVASAGWGRASRRSRRGCSSCETTARLTQGDAARGSTGPKLVQSDAARGSSKPSLSHTEPADGRDDSGVVLLRGRRVDHAGRADGG